MEGIHEEGEAVHLNSEMVKWSWQKRLNSFKYALKGIAFMVRTQHNAWIHSTAALLVIFSSFYFQISRIEWLFVILSIGLVFMAELINTSIETLTNIVSPQKQEMAGRVKDLAAGAVLVAAFTALIIGIIIFIPKIFG